MSHGVGKDYRGIETGPLDAPFERASHRIDVAARCLIAGEDPPIRVLGHIALADEDLGDIPGEGLTPHTTSLRASPKPTPRLVEAPEARAQYLAVSQTCGETQLDEKPDEGVAIMKRGLEELLLLGLRNHVVAGVVLLSVRDHW